MSLKSEVLIDMLSKLIAASLITCSVAFCSLTATLELPGVQTPNQACGTATTCVIGLQTFESGMNGAFTSFASKGNPGSFAGTLTGSSFIVPANQYGGAGGNGNYLVSFTGQTETLNISATPSLPGANFFGLWLSSANTGNSFTISTTGGDFTYNNLFATLCPGSGYCGNSNPVFSGNDQSQAFAYLDFVSSPGTYITSVTFAQNQTMGGGFETDNLAVGFIAPEPSVTGMTIAGAGLLAGCLLLRRFRPNATVGNRP